MLFRLMRGLATLATAAVAGALLLSFLAPYLQVADSIAHFRLHLLVCAALGGAILALAGLRVMGIAALTLAAATALLGLRPAFPGPVGDARAAGPAQDEIVIAQFNLLFHNKEPERVIDLIRTERPDVVTLQEVSRVNRPILARLSRDYPHQILCPFLSVGGVAVLSRLPLAAGENRFCLERQGYAWLRVMKEGRAISVASLHLHWPYPFRQAAQLDTLEAAFRATPRPVLLGGDFNAAPWSHAANRIAEATAAPLMGGLRISIDIEAWPGAPTFPMFIDHVAADPTFSPIEARSIRELGSDHRMILARLGLPSDR